MGATQVSTAEVYLECWKEWASRCAGEGVPYNAISVPKLPDFFF